MLIHSVIIQIVLKKDMIVLKKDMIVMNLKRNLLKVFLLEFNKLKDDNAIFIENKKLYEKKHNILMKDLEEKIKRKIKRIRKI